MRTAMPNYPKVSQGVLLDTPKNIIARWLISYDIYMYKYSLRLVENKYK